MKVIWRIILLLIIVLIIFYLMDDRIKENEPLESPVKSGTAVPVPGKGDGQIDPQKARPDAGLSLLVGQNSDALVEQMGKPDRVEPSDYGYDWWIYQSDHQFMAGVKEGKVNQIYSASVESDVAPFEIGQDVEDIYRSTIIESEIVIPIAENVYTFTLNSDDVNSRMLVEYENVYAQLFTDVVDGKLEAVRFIDPITLVLHQPYDMSYMGEIVNSPRPSSTIQVEVDRAMERQILDLTNIYREKHGVPTVKNMYELNELARKHSEDMALENYFSNESPATGNLANRLKEAGIEHRKAGENIAFDYVDAIEAVHGWLNSPAHRDVLLNKDFTHIGTGAYGKHYTQNFIRAQLEEKRRQ